MANYCHIHVITPDFKITDDDDHIHADNVCVNNKVTVHTDNVRINNKVTVHTDNVRIKNKVSVPQA
jgi:hypothetical protein